MSFCKARDGTDNDVCFLAGASTETYGPADGQPGSGCLVGINSSVDFGVMGQGGTNMTCGVGCGLCDDHPNMHTAWYDHAGGRRWLHRHPTLPNRDARGMNHDLPTGKARPFHWVANYVRGSCWNNAGVECFDTDVCFCFGRNDARSECGTRQGPLPSDPERYFMPDSVMYSGHYWPVGMGCRSFYDLPGQSTQLNAAQHVIRALPAPAFLRSVPGRCGNNWLTMCIARVPNSQCPNSYIRSGELSTPPGPRPDWYQPAAIARAPVSVRVDWNTMHLGGDGFVDITDYQRNQIALRNNVLQFARNHVFPGPATGLKLDRIENVYLLNNGSTAPYDWWTRSWNAQGMMINQTPIVPGAITKIKLKNAGLAVPATTRIVAAGIDMVCVPQRIQTGYGNQAQIFVVPHVRLRVYVKTILEATLPPSAIITRDWFPESDPRRNEEVTVETDENGNYRVASGNDTFLFLDSNDNVVAPPGTVKWEGFIGAYNNENREAPMLRVDTTDCLVVFQRMNGLAVPGWPCAATTNPASPNTIYGGSVRLYFIESPS